MNKCVYLWRPNKSMTHLSVSINWCQTQIWRVSLTDSKMPPQWITGKSYSVAENLNGSNINTSTMLDPVLPHRVTKTHPLPALQQLHLLHLPPQPLYTWREKKGSKSSNLQRIHEVSSNNNMFAFHSVLLDTTVPLPFQKEQLGNILAPNTLCLSS